MVLHFTLLWFFYHAKSLESVLADCVHNAACEVILDKQHCLSGRQLGGLTVAKTDFRVILVEQQCLASQQLCGLTAAKTSFRVILVEKQCIASRLFG